MPGDDRILRVLHARARGVPRRIPGCVMWLDSTRGVTLGGTPRATGTTPPAVTLTGQLEQSIAFRGEIQTTGARGVATFRYSYDGGATYVQSGQLTAATFTTTNGMVLNFPAGTYTNDNVYVGTVAAWNDQSGKGNHATQGTAANQPKVAVAGGRVSLVFDAVNIGLGHPLTLQAPATVAFVAKSSTDAAGAYQTLASFSASGTHGIFCYLSSGGANGWGFYYGTPCDSGVSLSSGFKTAVGRIRAVNDLDLRTNSAQITSTAGISTYNGGAWVGEPVGAAQPMLGEIAILAAFNRALLVPEMRALERYLKQRCGT